MFEVFNKLTQQVYGAWRFRWPALLVCWCVALPGWVLVYALPDTYEVRSRVFVDTDSVLRPLLQGLAPDTNIASKVNMITRALLSRPQLEDVARETGLYLRATTPEDFERLIENLGVQITLRSSGDDLYTLSYSDHDPEMAYRVVQSLLDTFVESSLGENRTDSSQAEAFLLRQIEEYERALTEAENRLAEFKKRNVGLMPGQGAGDYYDRLQTAMRELESAQSALNLALRKRDELISQIEGEEPTFGLLGGSQAGGPVSPLLARINELQAQLDALLLRYRERHPDVQALQSRLDTLRQQYEEERIAQEQIAIRAPQIGNTQDLIGLQLDINPVYQRMKLALSEAELEVIERREEVARLQADVDELQSLMDTLPEVEAQLARLNRDYEVNRVKHQQLLERLASARLAQDVDSQNNEVRFRVIEPPVVPQVSAGPPRALFMAVVLVAALGAGGAFGVLLNQLRPVFFDRETLSRFVELPVLATVGLSLDDRARASVRNGNLRLVAGVAMLIVVGGMLIVFMEEIAPIAQRLLTERLSS